ncbi:PilN domain-containing protein [Aphanothece sacrum]|uniref:Pilus biosynthesis protein n=1 Tax=Aphanothece sacrum FPU1 TaxID=1920663 RepID=A0A401ICY4_APHSA|nr:PilN domain-containing protein [Aphanothece sacrum]GBF79106.1 pilus biosynthesis protein [Aphanothece sacrum FPU1]GBF85153.1 pilus biosynthesis protein [Aphanothece sacrum FPU3]
MYSLDINFLKDRHLDTSKTPKVSKAAGSSLKQQLPILIGGAVMIILPALTASSLLVLNQLSNQTQENIKTLENELAQLNAQNKSIEEIEAKVKQNNEEIQGLVGVFDQIKPWSAIFQEINQQIPPQVQVGSIAQDGLILTIAGYALNYDDVNDFLLKLQSSPLFIADQTKIVDAVLADFPIEVTGKPENVEIETPKAVKYTIVTQITDKPSKELQDKFNENGAKGLINRLNTLEQKGAIKP